MKKENKKEEKKTMEEPRRSTFYFGFEIKEGRYYKVAFGRYVYYVKVTNITENKNIILAEDIYQKPVLLRLSRVTMIAEMSEEEFQEKVEIAKRKMKEGEE